jgi:hypothetical protein
VKRGTSDHPKVDELCALLSVPRYAAVGVLNTLWDWASRYVPQGDIGKYSDVVIAKKIDWEDDPAVLLSALIHTGWIDADEAHRLIIHDWPDHCEDFIHTSLARQTLLFADGTMPKLTKLTEKERIGLEEKYKAQASAAQSADRRRSAQNGAQKRPTKPLPSHSQDREPNGSLMGRVPPDELAGTLPLIDGTDFELSKAQLQEWGKAYPALDIKQQLLAYKAWLNANPEKRKTRKGQLKSVVYWLSGKQDKAGNPSLFGQTQTGTGGNNGRPTTQSREANTNANAEKVRARLRGLDTGQAERDSSPDAGGDQRGMPMADSPGVTRH